MSGGTDKFQGEIDMSAASPIEIGLVLYSGVQMAAVLGMTDLFTVADRLARRKHPDPSTPLLRISHWQREHSDETPRRVFDTAPGAGGAPAFLVLAPGLGDPVQPEEAALFAKWLRDSHGAGTSLGSVCKGAFLLGETGLLAGRTVTTHWTYAEPFRKRFPDARVEADRLIIDDGDIITAGGVMAWTDLALKLIDRFLGPTVMIETAQVFVVDPPGREQSYYSAFSPRLTHGDAAVLKVQHWLQATDAKEIDLTTLAKQAGLEERTFLRRFQKATGHTTTEYCQRLRVGKARELLQFGTLSFDQVAWEVGYSDPGAFRKVFTRIVGLTPNDYRRRFRATAR
ncbi:GlxA family transcriptional regulator [Microvirga arabica]|uniref:GlxA family transcriptional regulator n=1 Tax=Microvirga arabica TaxID=1128671 RepID=UPI001939E3CF|nr:GlxA family transcriptional regulator [Microvirga arabica]MBM1172672.1 GlxA family transcriptional regulator [Microvirga arabica]